MLNKYERESVLLCDYYLESYLLTDHLHVLTVSKDPHTPGNFEAIWLLATGSWQLVV